MEHDAATTDCPPCPKCKLTVATPLPFDHHGRRSPDPRAMFCPACGEEWIETDLDRVAKAWRAICAYWAQEHPDAPQAQKGGAT